jgi:hypothetical protein
MREARRGEALELCHDPVAPRRDAQLEAWATREFGTIPGATWFELAGSATSLLGVIVLLAVAADEASTAVDLHAAAELYSPWAGALSLMLDSYVDQLDDVATQSWSAIAHYPDVAVAEQRIAALARHVLLDAVRLRHGERHALVVAAMLAMYLTSDDVTSGPLAASTRRLRRSGGSLTGLLVPLLRAWRLAYGQRR